MAGSSTASWPRAASRAAAARAIASAMITSVARGRWGPCASTAPTGTIATVFVRSRSRTSSQVRCARSRTAMGGWIVPGPTVDRQPSTAGAIEYFYGSPGARVVVAQRDTVAGFRRAARSAGHLKTILVLGDNEFDERLARAPAALDPFPTHRDDAAIWLFSGGTTGQPKAVVQTHTSFANTTECYAKGTIGYTERDVTLSVPKLYFGYATGSNLLFPFSVGAATALFPEAATAEVLFEKIARFRPTILINVPTMINQMVSHPAAPEQDLSCVRLATSAGHALPGEVC